MTITVQPTDDFDTCLKLRIEVFVEEQNVPAEIEHDEYDAQAQHFLAFDGTQTVGTARTVTLGEVGKIGRVCVVKSHRGSGVGADLIRACIAQLREQPGVTRARLGAQVQTLGFYEKLGFHVVSPVYEEAGIDHQDMEMAL